MREYPALPHIQPRWADQSSNKVEPESGDKDDGFNTGDTIPSNWYNWLLDNLAEFASKSRGCSFNNFIVKKDHTGYGNILAICYHPEENYWLMIGEDGSNNKYALFSRSLDRIVATPIIRSTIGSYTITPDSLRAVPDYYVLLATNTVDANLIYSNDGFATVSKKTVGGDANTLNCIGVSEDGKVVVAKGGTTPVIYYASVVSGTYTQATTTITSGTLKNVVSIKHLGGSNWILLQNSGHTWTSNDNGDNWSTTNTSPYDIFNEPFYNLDANIFTGRIVVSGRIDSSEGMHTVFSDSGGNYWESANCNYDLFPIADEPLSAICYIGGATWLIGGAELVNAALPNGNTDEYNLFVSYDDGATWHKVTILEDLSGVLNDITMIHSDGKIAIAVIDSPTSYDYTYMRSLGLIK